MPKIRNQKSFEKHCYNYYCNAWMSRRALRKESKCEEYGQSICRQPNNTYGRCIECDAVVLTGTLKNGSSLKSSSILRLSARKKHVYDVNPVVMMPLSNGAAVSDAPNIAVLDGGFSSQLSCHVGHVIDGDPLWSARFLHTHPYEVVNTHLDFLRAGADLIITNTYQASVDGFVEHLGVSREQAYGLIVRAVELAKQARSLYLEEYQDFIPSDRPPLVVGSVGPYGAHLHDGSEYDGSYADNVSVEIMREWHRPRIQALVEAGVDMLALETIPCHEEAEMLCDLLREFPNIKAWLSFSCKDNESIAHGESFQKVAKKCWETNPDQLVAVGVNCCAPSYILNLLKGFNDDRPHNPIPLIVYPNSGEKYNPQIGWIDRDKCEPVEVFIPDWLDLGVRYVGGCCRTYAADVTRIRNQVHRWRDRYHFQHIQKTKN